METCQANGAKEPEKKHKIPFPGNANPNDKPSDTSNVQVVRTSLSGLVAHSRDSRGDLDMMVALVCMMGLKDHTLMTPSTSRLATLRPEQSTLRRGQGGTDVYIRKHSDSGRIRSVETASMVSPAVHDGGVVLAVFLLAQLDEGLLRGQPFPAHASLAGGGVQGLALALRLRLHVQALPSLLSHLRKEPVRRAV